MMVEEIKKIQRQLKALGFYPNSIDGKFDVKTKKAVMLFQKSKGLKQDGNIGPKTLAALNVQQYWTPPLERPDFEKAGVADSGDELMAERSEIPFKFSKNHPVIQPRQKAKLTSSEALSIAKTRKRSSLGARLRQRRKEIIASGVPLLDWEGIEREKAERRGGYRGE